MTLVFGMELLVAVKAVPSFVRAPEVLAAMRVECCGAVRADDLEILDAVVCRVAVDVVENQRHPLSVPELADATQLAARNLEAFFVEAPFQGSAVEGGVLDQNFL